MIGKLGKNIHKHEISSEFTIISCKQSKISNPSRVDQFNEECIQTLQTCHLGFCSQNSAKSQWFKVGLFISQEKSVDLKKIREITSLPILPYSFDEKSQFKISENSSQ